MRILSLGFPLPGPPLENYSFASAPAFFDYDALVVDPLALSALIDAVVESSEEHITRSGRPVVNAPSAPQDVGLADLLRDRREETSRLLARGGLVVSFAHPNAVHRRVAGMADCDRYCWLPAPSGLAYREPFLRRGDGSTIGAIEHDHPFGPLIERFRGKLAYRAYFAEEGSGFEKSGRVVARSAGGAAVAVELSAGGGRVVFVPPPARPPAGEERYAYSGALQDAVRRTLRLAASVSPPRWLGEYDLPGLGERLAALEGARRARSEADEAVAAAEEAVEGLNRYRRLLWQEGKYGLEEPVRAALALIGFRVLPDDLDRPARIELDRTVALLEVEGSDGAIGMEGHHRLRRRLEEAIGQGRPRRGLLVINGQRSQPPAGRPRQYEEALRTAAETMRYCVATGEQLFHAVRAALAGDAATVAAFRERLLTTEGVLRED